MKYKEAAEQLGYSYEHTIRLVKAGKLGKNFETGYRITQEDIDKFIANRPKVGRPKKFTKKQRR